MPHYLCNSWFPLHVLQKLRYVPPTRVATCSRLRRNAWLQRMDVIFCHDNPCHWCCGNSCIYQGNKCKPSKYIASRQTTFKILSRNGLGFDSCTATGGDCTVCLVAVMSHLLDKKRIHPRMHGHFVHTHIVIPPSSFATYCKGGMLYDRQRRGLRGIQGWTCGQFFFLRALSLVLWRQMYD